MTSQPFVLIHYQMQRNLINNDVKFYFSLSLKFYFKFSLDKKLKLRQSKVLLLVACLLQKKIFMNLSQLQTKISTTMCGIH